MTVMLLFLTGIIAGSFGALLGLGGGVIVIPVLTVFFELPIHDAIGISLLGVIATSTGAAMVHIREGKVDLRLGMLLELSTTVGAIAGAVVAVYASPRVLYLLYSALLSYNSYSMYQRDRMERAAEASAGAERPGQEGLEAYRAKNITAGMALSSLAGILAGLLGVGGGLVKIPAMYLLMGVPLKVATATSNFMIGITAGASAFIYYLNGSINPLTAVPVVLGVFAGALAGAQANTRISTRALRRVFIIFLLYIAYQMVRKGISG